MLRLKQYINNSNSNFLLFKELRDEKKITIGILRFIGALLVILCHLGKLPIFSLVGVGIFITCTAFLSLNKKTLNWKRYLSLLFVFYFFNLIYEIFQITINHNIDYLSIFLPVFFSRGRLWYLRVYMVFFFLIPLFNKAIKDRRDALYFLIYFILFSIIQYFLPKFEFQANSFFVYHGWHILHFINFYLLTISIIHLVSWDKRLLKFNRIFWWVGFFVCYIFVVVLQHFLNYRIYYNTIECSIITFSFTFAFFFIKFKSNKITKFFCMLGYNSLYFYLIDNIFDGFIDGFIRGIIPGGFVSFCVILFVEVSFIIIFILILTSFKKWWKQFKENRIRESIHNSINVIDSLFKNILSQPEVQIIKIIYEKPKISFDKICEQKNFDQKYLYHLLQLEIIKCSELGYEIDNNYRLLIDNYLEEK